MPKKRVEGEREEYFQIDIVKAFMIFMVIFDHTVSWTFKSYMFVDLWERISIPMFLIIMGFNMGLSFNRLETRSFRKLYSYTYFKKKFWRYVFPFLVLLVFSLLIGSIFVNFFDYPAFEQYRGLNFHFSQIFLGILHFWGPGNWFIPVLFLSILIMPLLYKGLSSNWFWRIFTIVVCVVIEILVQHCFNVFVHKALWPPSTLGEYYTYFNLFNWVVSTPFWMLSGIGLGMWFSTRNNKPSLFKAQNIFMWIIGPLSLLYIVLFRLYVLGELTGLGLEIYELIDFEFIRTDYTFYVFPYSALLFLIFLAILPKEAKSGIGKAIKGIGRATYHILLVQILYFAVIVAIWGEPWFGFNFNTYRDNATIFGVVPASLSEEAQFLMVMSFYITNIVICVGFGVLWWYCEAKIREHRLKRKLSYL